MTGLMEVIDKVRHLDLEALSGQELYCVYVNEDTEYPDNDPLASEITLDLFADPEWAVNHCDVASETFAELLREHGLNKVKLVKFEDNYDGYFHYAVVVGDNYTVVDWTWRQFGTDFWGADVLYDEFPHPLIMPISEYVETFFDRVGSCLSADTENVRITFPKGLTK